MSHRLGRKAPAKTRADAENPHHRHHQRGHKGGSHLPSGPEKPEAQQEKGPQGQSKRTTASVGLHEKVRRHRKAHRAGQDDAPKQDHLQGRGVLPFPWTVQKHKQPQQRQFGKKHGRMVGIHVEQPETGPGPGKLVHNRLEGVLLGPLPHRRDIPSDLRFPLKLRVAPLAVRGLQRKRPSLAKRISQRGARFTYGNSAIGLHGAPPPRAF